MGKKERARLIDVALAAGVSRQTAGAVLLGGRTNTRASGDTESRVREAARKLNYQPNQAARRLKGLNTGVVGILCENLRETTHGLIVAKLVDILAQRNLTASLATLKETTRSLDQQIEEMVWRGLDGMLVLDERLLHRRRSMERLQTICPNLVYYAGGYDTKMIEGHSIDVDRIKAARLGVRHLLKRGCRRIAFLGGPSVSLDQQQRLAGYRSELETCGMAVEQELIRMADWARWHEGGMLPEVREQLAGVIRQFVQQAGADGIVVGALPTFLTPCLVQQLRELGLDVPGQVAVLAIRDDPMYPVFSPRISAVKLHHDAVALPMVELLEQMMRSDNYQRMQSHLLVEPELMARESA